MFIHAIEPESNSTFVCSIMFLTYHARHDDSDTRQGTGTHGLFAKKRPHHLCSPRDRDEYALPQNLLGVHAFR